MVSSPPPDRVAFDDLAEAAALAAELVVLRSRIAYFTSAETTSFKVEVTVAPIAELDFAELDSAPETDAAENIRAACIYVLELQASAIENNLAALGVVVT